jgi:CheY-like chemotaxis protein
VSLVLRHTSRAPSASFAVTRAKHVLVVEDEPAICAFVAWTLEDAGYSVATAKHGRDALAEMKRRMPDVLILDLMMPVMDGSEVIAVCRADPAMKQLPIIAMSAVHGPRLMGRLDVQAFLLKPFDLDSLVASLRDVLG